MQEDVFKINSFVSKEKEVKIINRLKNRGVEAAYLSKAGLKVVRVFME